MSGGGHGSHPRVLARQFAAALSELRDSWELEYWHGGALPRTAALPREATPAEATPREDAPPPQALRSEALRSEAPRSEAPRSEAPRSEAPRPDAPRPEAPPRAPEPARPSLPVVGDEASAPGGGALRDQAREWSPATKLEYLRRRNIGDCQRCGLARTRTNIVFGVGDPSAQIMFVGEAPGADEDRVGEPFVGRAGQRLDAWIAAVGLRREQVYIANVLKCRPPGNRDPKPEEVDRCSPFLQAQIRAVAPRVIVALGRHAAMLLTRREDLSMRAMRGARLFYEVPAKGGDARSIPIVATYHPAYVLRQEGSESRDGTNAEELVMQDLRRALELAQDSGGTAARTR